MYFEFWIFPYTLYFSVFPRFVDVRSGTSHLDVSRRAMLRSQSLLIKLWGKELSNHSAQRRKMHTEHLRKEKEVGK